MLEQVLYLWNLIIQNPLTNILILLSTVLLHNFALSIVALTVLVRLAMLPLSIKQLKATRAMQSLQPELVKLQKKYAKDKQKLAQEQMALYKNAGVSPAGCMVPMLVQMPIWIALYQSIIHVLAATPETFLALSKNVYNLPILNSVLPLNNHFLWLDLAAPDVLYILPVLVAGTMWLQQKQVTPPAVDPATAQTNQLMLWMMPIMFGFLTIQFPSGLALYWIVSNSIAIITQYKYTGTWGISFGKKQAVTVMQPLSPESKPAAKPTRSDADTKPPKLPPAKPSK